MSKIAIIGSFGKGLALRDGQTVKTQQLSALLKKLYDPQSIREIDTRGWKKAPVQLFAKVVKAVRDCDKVIILPANGSIKVIPFIAYYARKSGVKVYYDVIGGWLPELMARKKTIANVLKKLDGIWVESKEMKRKLGLLGFKNVSVVPNFKALVPLTDQQVVSARKRMSEASHLTFTIFSRILKEKGIGEAIEAIRIYNSGRPRRPARLKIYGQIEPSYTQEFEQLMAGAGDFAEYCGKAAPDESTTLLADTYMLLFPTYYFGEGFPGTLIDAYCAGVPVIATEWRYNREFVEEGVTGYLIPPKDTKALVDAIVKGVKEEAEITRMSLACLQKANEFSRDKAQEKIVRLLQD